MFRAHWGTLALVGWTVACGDGGAGPADENRAPIAVGNVPSQQLREGDTVTVDLAQYFSDPDDDPLTYSALSSDSAVATVLVAGSDVTVVGDGNGEASITVTARDPDGLTAIQSFDATVEAIPGPEVVTPLTDLTLGVEEADTVELAASFSHPEGTAMTFSATSSNVAVATLSLTGGELVVEAVAVGNTQVSASATDAKGLSASQSFTVFVRELSGGFYEAFTTPASLTFWDTANAAASVVDETLRLTGLATDAWGAALRTVEPEITGPWRVSARLTNAADLPVSLVMGTTSSRFPVFRLDVGHQEVVGTMANYAFAFFDTDANSGQGGWSAFVNGFGDSEAINEVPGDFTEVTIQASGDVYTGYAGDSQLFQVRAITTGVKEIALYTWPEATGLFDWVQIERTAASTGATSDGVERKVDGELRAVSGRGPALSLLDLLQNRLPSGLRLVRSGLPRRRIG